MKEKIPHTLIQDLLPNYIEHLTSKETNGYIEEHIRSCATCKEMYEQMKAKEPERSNEKKEIDYLKTIREKNRRKIGWISAGTILALLLVVLIKVYGIGNVAPLDSMEFYTSVGMNNVVVDGTLLNSKQGVARIDWKKKGNDLYISVIETPKTPWTTGYFHASYSYEQQPDRIYFNGLLLSVDGQKIDPAIARLLAYRAKGDEEAVRQILSLGGGLPVQTVRWNDGKVEIIAKESIREVDIKRRSLLLFGLVEECAQVEWIADGQSQTFTANDFGSRIKEAYKDPLLLQQILRENGQTDWQQLQFRYPSDEEIEAIRLTLSQEGKAFYRQYTQGVLSGIQIPSRSGEIEIEMAIEVDGAWIEIDPVVCDLENCIVSIQEENGQVEMKVMA